MSISDKLIDLFPAQARPLVCQAGVQVLYVEESYRTAFRPACAAGLGFLFEPDLHKGQLSGISSSHYWPPLKHNQLKRESPRLFHEVPGLGGVSEQGFSPKAGCIIVDNSVDTGRTLWMASQYLFTQGYKPEQVLVAASVWVNGIQSTLDPFEARPLRQFRDALGNAERMLRDDLTPFLATGKGFSQANIDGLPAAIAQYCAVV
ncbi:hypothetical protein HYU18_02380 [Candidatus Woesearchaeota archaeon]|nr:hypothetical protein [Candidatus Woesearchaeota archaeon]